MVRLRLELVSCDTRLYCRTCDMADDHFCPSISSCKAVSNSSLVMGIPGEGVGVCSPSVEVDDSKVSSSASLTLRTRASRTRAYKSDMSCTWNWLQSSFVIN